MRILNWVHGKTMYTGIVTGFFKKPDSPPNFRKYLFRLLTKKEYLKICVSSGAAVFKALFGIRFLKISDYFESGKKYTCFWEFATDTGFSISGILLVRALP